MEETKGTDTKFMGGQVNASCWELLGMERRHYTIFFVAQDSYEKRVSRW